MRSVDIKKCKGIWAQTIRHMYSIVSSISVFQFRVASYISEYIKYIQIFHIKPHENVNFFNTKITFLKHAQVQYRHLSTVCVIKCGQGLLCPILLGCIILWGRFMWFVHSHINGLVQQRRKSSALTTELRLSCTNPSIYTSPAPSSCHCCFPFIHHPNDILPGHTLSH